MFIAQPTLSQQIRQLEQIVGTPLLHRRHDPVRLTVAGAVLLDARGVGPRSHPAAGRGVIGLDELAGMDIIHGPRPASTATYDRWLRILRATHPRFECPARCSRSCSTPPTS